MEIRTCTRTLAQVLTPLVGTHALALHHSLSMRLTVSYYNYYSMDSSACNGFIIFTVGCSRSVDSTYHLNSLTSTKCKADVIDSL